MGDMHLLCKMRWVGTMYLISEVGGEYAFVN